MLDRFGPDARFVFLAGQIAFPLGYFLAGYLSDRLGKIRVILVPLILLHSPCQFFLYSPDLSLGPAIVLGGLTRFFFAANMQLLTIAALERLQLKGFSLSRTAGTAGFFVVHLALFLLEVNFPGSLASHASASGTGGRIGSGFLVLFALAATRVQANRTGGQDYYFLEAIRILRRPPVLEFFGISLLYFAGYQVVDYYLGGYLNHRYGMSGVYGGWCLAVLLELPFLPLCARIHRGYGTRPLFAVALLAGILRFALLYYDVHNGLPGLIFVQLLHGIHFTGYYMGGIFRLRHYFPDRLYGTGQGLFMVIATATGALIGAYISGILLEPRAPDQSLDYSAVFLAALMVHVAVFFGFLLIPDPEKKKVGHLHETDLA